MAKKTDMGGEMPPMPPEAMMAPEPEAAPQSGGQVMLQIPKDVFMGIHQQIALSAQTIQRDQTLALGKVGFRFLHLQAVLLCHCPKSTAHLQL